MPKAVSTAEISAEQSAYAGRVAALALKLYKKTPKFYTTDNGNKFLSVFSLYLMIHNY